MKTVVPVYCVVTPGVLLLDLAGPAEVFRLTGNHSSTLAFDLRYVGPEPSIATSVGLTLASIAPLPESVADDALVLVAGVMTGAPVSAKTVAWLKRVRPQRLVTVCSGALLAARAGLLAGKFCTTHHTLTAELANLEPTATVLEDRLFVTDGTLATSAGITSGVDLALKLVADRDNHKTAAAVARDMVVYMRRAGHDPQLSPWLDGRNHLHPAVHKTQDAISADPAADWTLESMARAGHTSPRQLGRLFTEHVGHSPLDYLHRVRIALARDLISGSALSLERIAETAGFGSLRQMRRVWSKLGDGPPSKARVSALEQ